VGKSTATLFVGSRLPDRNSLVEVLLREKSSSPLVDVVSNPEPEEIFSEARSGYLKTP
jgi:hypothetical protein